MSRFKSNRRDFLKVIGAATFVTGFGASLPLPSWAQTSQVKADHHGLDVIQAQKLFDLDMDYAPFTLDGKRGRATAINGTVPGPILRWREGDRVKLNVTNSMMDSHHSSLHWHGILLPFEMDGVPGLTYDGIRPGETYEYEFDVHQAGTYWYHSHSRFQEQTGAYAPLIIDPKDGAPFKYDRDYVVMLSDWSFTDPEVVFANINRSGDYYNHQKRTVFDFFDGVSKKGWSNAMHERFMWGKMRMSPVDLADVTGATYTYLMNGNSPDMNWTGIFNPGEIVRLRFINAAAMSNFDVRIPGLNMDVVMVDGKAVKPVNIHEFRIGVAETYDVLVTPKQDQPFTIFAESIDRSGFARGTLSPQAGLSAPVPKLRARPVRKMSDMGMMAGMDMDSGHMMHMGETGDMQRGHNMGMHGGAAMQGHHMMQDPSVPGPNGPEPFREDQKNTNVVMVVTDPQDRLHEPGIGLGDDGWRVLTYKDLVSNEPQVYSPHVDREMTINVTANMERYMFSFDGKKYSEQPGPFYFEHNERLRLYLVNHTMMEHPIHLHGMWMQLENGQSHDDLPYKHTLLLKPGEKLSVLITPVEKGDWAFHCHLLYHMEAGMMQAVRVA